MHGSEYVRLTFVSICIQLKFHFRKIQKPRSLLIFATNARHLSQTQLLAVSQ